MNRKKKAPYADTEVSADKSRARIEALHREFRETFGVEEPVTPRKVWIARTETYPGEYANVTVGVEEFVREGESTQAALDRSEHEVATRLHAARERRIRRGAWWTDLECRDLVRSGQLETFERRSA